MRFVEVPFGEAPREEWANLRRDLLPYEFALACRQHDIGCVAEYSFHLEADAPPAVFHAPAQLNDEHREWVAKEMNELLATGVVEWVAHVECASSVVLVE